MVVGYLVDFSLLLSIKVSMHLGGWVGWLWGLVVEVVGSWGGWEIGGWGGW